MSSKPEKSINDNYCYTCKRSLEKRPNGCSNYQNHYKIEAISASYNLSSACSWGSTMIPVLMERKKYYQFPYQVNLFIGVTETKRKLLDILQK